MKDHTKQILIVEDEVPFQEIYRDILESEGYEVHVAEDGQLAIEYLSMNTPDLVLLDIILPKQTGLDVLRHMREAANTKNIPVVVYSVIDDREQIDLAMKLGATDFTIKGQTSAYEVLEKVNELLGNPPMSQQIQE